MPGIIDIYDYNSNNKYIYSEPPLDIIQLCKKDIIKWTKEIEDLSNINKIPILYYEDIDEDKIKDMFIWYEIDSAIIKDYSPFTGYWEKNYNGFL